MPPLELSLSEVLLLGFCRELCVDGSATIFEVFDRHLRPFVPLFTRTTYSHVPLDDLPRDIQWYAMTEEESPPDPPQSERSIKCRGKRSRPRKYHFLQEDVPSFGDGSFRLGRARSRPHRAFISDGRIEGGQLPGCAGPSRRSGSIVMISWDRSRRALIELVIERIGRVCPAADTELLERRAIPGDSRWLWDFAAFLDEVWPHPSPPFDYRAIGGEIPWWVTPDHAVFGLSDRLDQYMPSDWQPEVVQQALDGMVPDDGREIFDTGRRFARLIEACGSFDRSLAALAELLVWFDPRSDGPAEAVAPDPGSWEDRLHDIADQTDAAHRRVVEELQSLVLQDSVRRYQHAEWILKAEIVKRQQIGSPAGLALAPLYWGDGVYDEVPCYESEGTETHFDERYKHLGRWSEASASAWLAFGDVIGTLWEMDCLVGAKDRPLPPLRAYQLRGDSSADRIRAAVELAEGDLTHDWGRVQDPEHIVYSVARGIEGLARRLWPSDVPRGGTRKEGLVAILDQKRRAAENDVNRVFSAERELERRFATVALSLYTTYRRQATHDPDAFRCSWAEAQFFVSGLRVLLQLSEQLARPSEAQA